ncbi:MAG: hypothetical protein E7508_01765 [Ruminococcus sp.]|nr:hypothetical protein [Ruminococcus sp.]
MNDINNLRQYLPGLTEDMPLELLNLAKLLEEQCIEFITDESDFKIIYLANDCVESFLEFADSEIKGECLTDYDGYTDVSVEKYGDRFLLVFHQGNENVFTVTFTDVRVSAYSYNYGNTGHFWVYGYCDLRLIDYWLGIINDKYKCLTGYCTEQETELAELSQFKPLRYFNSVPEKYMSNSDYVEFTTEKSAEIFMKLTFEAGDKALYNYIKKRGINSHTEKVIAKLLTKPKHSEIVNLIIRKIKTAASVYPDRNYGDKAGEYNRIYQAALSEAEKYKNSSSVVSVYKEEPFAHMSDSMEFKVQILVTENKRFKRKYRVITFC